MVTYLITYDLNQEDRRPPIVAKIKEFGTWARLSESSYAVRVSLSVDQVYAHLRPATDANDTLYIITLTKPYRGFGPAKVNDWLDSSLPL